MAVRLPTIEAGGFFGGNLECVNQPLHLAPGVLHKTRGMPSDGRKTPGRSMDTEILHMSVSRTLHKGLEAHHQHMHSSGV